MGNIDSYGYDPTKQSKLIDTQPQYQVYQSQSGQQYQKYTISHNSKQPFQQSYQFRINEKHDDFVDILYIGQAQGFIACTNRGKYQVITERITYRLNSLNNINFKNSLVILKCSLRGFGDLYKKYGAFGIKDKMIGINKRNKVKMWLNHNFALNQPQEIPTMFTQLSPKDRQRQMVQGIFDLINCKTEASQLWTQLMHVKEINNPSTFEESLNLVQYFGRQKHLNINENISNIFKYKFSHDKIKNTQHGQYHSKINQPIIQYENRIHFTTQPLPNNTNSTMQNRFEILQQIPKQYEPTISYRFPITNHKQISLATNIRMNYLNASVLPIESTNQLQSNIPQSNLQPETNQQLQKIPIIQLMKQIKLVVPSQGIIEQKQQMNSKNNSMLQNNNIIEKQDNNEIEGQLRMVPIETAKQVLIQQQQKDQYQNLLIYQNHHNSNMYSYQQQYKDRSSSVIQENNNLQTIKPSYTKKVSLTNMQLQQNALQNIKTSINVSLVDTREIKRKSIQFQQETNSYPESSKNKPLSYREMRRILLEQIQQNG